MTGSPLKNIVISTIKPVKKKDHGLSPAALFDYMCLDGFTPVVFLYKPEDRITYDSSKLVDCMKESLSEVLVPFYPFAGRWVRTNDARLRELQCNDEGVPFIEASIDEDMESLLNTTEFVGTDYLAGHQLLGLDPTQFHQNVNFPLPSVFVQVTTFKCGGVALNVCFNHMTSDGVAMFLFLKAWSEFALHRHTSIVPSHDRSLINSYTATQFEEFLQTYSAAVAAIASAANGSEQKSLPLPPLIQRVVHVKRKLVEDLKAEAAKCSQVVLTTMDIISAQIWRAVSATKFDHDKPCRVGCAVQCRQRCHAPPLPEEYAGNAFLRSLFPPLPPREGEVPGAEASLSAARVVHDAVRAIGPSSVQDLMAAFFNFNNEEERHTLSVSSWYRFPMYEVSFGQGYGCPILASPNGFYKFPDMRVAIVCPPRPEISSDTIATVSFFLGQTSQLLDSLFSNQDFLSFFH